MSDFFFASGYLRVLYRYARSEGVSDDGLFRGTGFSIADLMRTDCDIPFAARMHFCENALGLTAPGLGLRAGGQLQLAAHGTLGTAMQTGDNLEVALQTFSRFLDARASFYTTRLDQRGRTARFSVDIEGLSDPLVPFFTETILQTILHCLGFFSGREQPADALHIGYPAPGYAAAYEKAFGAPVHFGTTDTWMCFGRDLLAMSSPEADPVVHADSVQRCLEQINRRLKEGDVCYGIETFLLDNPGRLWTLEEIAPLFSLSARSLIRRLKASGTTYQAVRDEVLKQQAATCLNTMSVEAAAAALGFADASSFRRTFRRWYGAPPRSSPSRAGQTR